MAKSGWGALVELLAVADATPGLYNDDTFTYVLGCSDASFL